MSRAPDSLKMKEEGVLNFLAAGTYLGGINLDFQMEYSICCRIGFILRDVQQAEMLRHCSLQPGQGLFTGQPSKDTRIWENKSQIRLPEGEQGGLRCGESGER